MEKQLREQLINGRFPPVPQARSKIMRSIKSKGNKSTELTFCNMLAKENIIGWETQKKMVGNPDVVFPSYKVVVFLDGCFWHGCPQCGHVPKTNSAYWKTKIENNINRDRKKTEALVAQGYWVIRFWEHELNENRISCMERTKEAIEEHLMQLIESDIEYFEIDIELYA